MKKTTYIYLAIFVIVGSIAIYLITQNRSGTMTKVLNEFAIKDTENVTKIFLADRDKNQVLLERTGPNSWTLNKKYKAFKPRIDLLLETMHSVEMKNPLSTKAKKAFLKDMLTQSVKTEIYTKGGTTPTLTYYVGGTTSDQLGTIMLIEGSQDPFVTWLPGFEGYLSTRYDAVEKGWRARDVYKLAPSSIREIIYDYPASAKESFKFTSDGKNFSVSHNEDNTPSIEVPAANAKDFLLGFTNVEYEAFYSATSEQKDSIRKSEPVVTISVKTEGKEATSIKFYNVKAEGHLQMAGRDPNDKSRFIAIMSDDPTNIVYVQRRNLQRIMKGYSDLAK